MRLAHPAYRVVVQDMRARARLFETLQDLLGAFHHPVEGLANHGQALIGCHWGTRWSGMGFPSE